MVSFKVATFTAMVGFGMALTTNINSRAYSTFEVDAAPDFVRPYVLRQYAKSHAVSVGARVYRFQVTGPSSNYAFTLMSTNAPESGYDFDQTRFRRTISKFVASASPRIKSKAQSPTHPSPSAFSISLP